MNAVSISPEARRELLQQRVISYLAEAPKFGYVTIRFEAGNPTLIEIHETVRLTAPNT